MRCAGAIKLKEGRCDEACYPPDAVNKDGDWESTQPVCASGITYINAAEAQADGYPNQCIKDGVCTYVDPGGRGPVSYEPTTGGKGLSERGRGGAGRAGECRLPGVRPPPVELSAACGTAPRAQPAFASPHLASPRLTAPPALPHNPPPCRPRPQAEWQDAAKNTVLPDKSKPSYDYGEALAKSLIFYDAQISGTIEPNYRRLDWRGNSCFTCKGACVRRGRHAWAGLCCVGWSLRRLSSCPAFQPACLHACLPACPNLQCRCSSCLLAPSCVPPRQVRRGPVWRILRVRRLLAQAGRHQVRQAGQQSNRAGGAGMPHAARAGCRSRGFELWYVARVWHHRPALRCPCPAARTLPLSWPRARSASLEASTRRGCQTSSSSRSSGAQVRPAEGARLGHRAGAAWRQPGAAALPATGAARTTPLRHQLSRPRSRTGPHPPHIHPTHSSPTRLPDQLPRGGLCLHGLNGQLLAE